MPLYPQYSFFNKENLNEGKSYYCPYIDSGDDSATMSEDLGNARKCPQTKIDVFKKKVNDNLKLLNIKMAGLIQDSMAGVDNICKQVKGCLRENEQNQLSVGKIPEQNGSGNIFPYHDGARQESAVTSSSKNATVFLNSVNSNPFSNGNVFAIQNIQQILGSNTNGAKPLKNNKRRCPSTSQSRKSKKNDPKSSESKLSTKKSNSLTSKTSESKKTTDSSKTTRPKTKRAHSRSQTMIKEADRGVTPTKSTVKEHSVKKRLSQIEKDYQNVIENLGKVEKMMESINRRKSIQNTQSTMPIDKSNSQKNSEYPSQKLIKKEVSNKSLKNEDQKLKSQKLKNEPTTTKKARSEHQKIVEKKSIDLEPSGTNSVATENHKTKIIKKILKADTKKEVKQEHIVSAPKIRSKPATPVAHERFEKINSKETTNDIEKTTVKTSKEKKGNEEERKTEKTDETTKQIEKTEHEEDKNQNEDKEEFVEATDNKNDRPLTPLTQIQLNNNLPNLDTMIDNAVNELGHINSSPFDISQNSSDLSFKTSENYCKFHYEKGFLNKSLSNQSSYSDESSADDEEKQFQITESFEELKNSFLEKLKTKLKSSLHSVKSAKTPKTSTMQMATDTTNKNLKTSQEKINITDSNLNQTELAVSKSDNLEDDQSSNKTLSSINSQKSISENEFSTKTDKGLKELKSEIKKANIVQKTSSRSFEELSNGAIMEVLQSQMLDVVNKQKLKNILTEDTLPIDKCLRPLSQKKSIQEQDNILENVHTELSQIKVTEEGDTHVQRESKKKITRKKRTAFIDMADKAFVDTEEYSETKHKQQKRKRMETRKKKNKELGDIFKASEDEEATVTIDDISDDQMKKNNAVIKKAKCKLTKPKTKQIIQNSELSSNDFEEIKAVENQRSLSATSGSSVSVRSNFFNFNENELNCTDSSKPIDPSKQISIQCKKMIADLVDEELTSPLAKLQMDGDFNRGLLHTIVGTPKINKSDLLDNSDTDLSEIVPDVHRIKAVSDLHDRMELQIKQTDSFDGFLNLMDRNRRKTIIKQAEKQDQIYKLNLRHKTSLRKKYPFKVVTSSTPNDAKTPKKDRKYVNSLWFSPKDFRLKRDSRIFNRKRMEMYCHTLNNGPTIPQCICKEEKNIEKASNYTVVVRSGIPLVPKTYSPCRGVQQQAASVADKSLRPRLNHCDILDDLTITDLAPFDSEYPRHDAITEPPSLLGTLFYKLASETNHQIPEEILSDLMAPKLSCTQVDCNFCKPKTKTANKKPQKKPKPNNSRKSIDSTRPSSKANSSQNLNPKIAAQLLTHNVGEIKTKKITIREQNSEKNSAKSKSRNVRRKSKMFPTKESGISQKMEKNLEQKMFPVQIPTINLGKRMGGMESPPKVASAFKGVELYLKMAQRKQPVNKLLRYINDPDNKVFQHITAMPVEVIYDNQLSQGFEEKIKEMQKILNEACIITKRGEAPISKYSKQEQQQPKTLGDWYSNDGNCTPGGSPNEHVIKNYNKQLNNPKPPQKKCKCKPFTNQEVIMESAIPQSRYRSSGFSFNHQYNSTNIKRQKPPLALKFPNQPKPKEVKFNVTSKMSERSSSSDRIVANRPRTPDCNNEKSYSKYSKDPLYVNREYTPIEMMSRDRKPKIDIKQKRKPFYLNDQKGSKPPTPKALKTCQIPANNRAYLDHLYVLQNRNLTLQGNIQKAINIIENKMIDLLSTDDNDYKKKTIDHMEKEINKVLKMINEQTYKTESDHSGITCKSDPIPSRADVSREFNVCQFPTVPNTHTDSQKMNLNSAIKMPRPPRKRAISKILKCRTANMREENYDLFNISEGTTNDESNVDIEQVQDTTQNESKRDEIYPSETNKETSMFPVLRCPSVILSETSLNLAEKTQKAVKGMSKEAFGKFANVIKTKTKLIINMTKKFGTHDKKTSRKSSILSILPNNLLADSVLSQIQKPIPPQLLQKTISSIISVHRAPITCNFDTSTDALSCPTTELSEFSKRCTENSLVSVSEMEPCMSCVKYKSLYPVQIRNSACCVRRRLTHEWCPFTRALYNLRDGKLFEHRDRLYPLHETSSNIRKLMTFLEGLSKIKESFNQATLNDIQLMWNPERRCSFHGSIESCQGTIFGNNEIKASSESLTSSASTSRFSDNVSEEQNDEVKSLKTDSSTTSNNMANIEQNESDNLEHTETENDISEDTGEVYKSESKLNQIECQSEDGVRSVKLELSETYLVSVSKSVNVLKFEQCTETDELYFQADIVTKNPHRYATFLKIFYLFFYGMVFLCMNAMNFAC